eukprot:scaffold91988_cov63-Phaeocystis_antarctica.AAC.1
MTGKASKEGSSAPPSEVRSAPPSKVRGVSFLSLLCTTAPFVLFSLVFCLALFFLLLLSSGPSLGVFSSSMISSYATLSARSLAASSASSLALRSSAATAMRRFCSARLPAARRCCSSSLRTIFIAGALGAGAATKGPYAGIGREMITCLPLRLAAARHKEESQLSNPLAWGSRAISMKGGIAVVMVAGETALEVAVAAVAPAVVKATAVVVMVGEATVEV